MPTLADQDIIARAVELKGPTRISVCIPCRNEEATIARVIEALRPHDGPDQLTDELLVLDDGSSDRSAQRARDAGARVVSVKRATDGHGSGSGKGNVLWASLLCSTGDLVVWIDADVVTAERSWVAKLILPLLLEPDLAIVKAAYARPTDEGGGGRTTELVVRPLVSLVAPMLSWIQQPLGGEVAVRRSLIERLPVMQGWGVEIAMLMDVMAHYGSAAIAQVDLGERRHRHHDLLGLRVQAAEVMATVLGRSGVDLDPAEPSLRLPDGEVLELNLAERPPIVDGSTPRSDTVGR